MIKLLYTIQFIKGEGLWTTMYYVTCGILNLWNFKVLETFKQVNSERRRGVYKNDST